MKNSPFCPQCGKELIDNAKFCPWCGSEQAFEEPQEEPVEVACKECGTVLAENQIFCHVCGRKRTKATSKQPIKKKVLGWIRHSLVLLIAVLFMSFAFLPIAQESFDIIKKDDVTLRFSALDNIIFCFDAMKSLDEDELMESPLYEELEELSENLLTSSEEDITSAEKAKIVKLTLRLALQSEESVFVPQLALSAILSLLYLLLAVAFLVISVIDFVFFCCGRENKKLSRIALGMLAAIPSLALVTGFATVTCLIGALTGLVITLVAVSVAVLAYLCVEHYFLGEEKKPIRVGSIVKRALSVVACLLMTFSVLLPMANYTVKANFNSSDKKTQETRILGVGFFDHFALNETQIELYEGDEPLGLTDLSTSYSYYTRKEFRTGDADSIDAEILVGAFSGAGAYRVAGLISLVSLFALLVSLAGGVLLWQNAIALISDTSPHGAVTIPVKVIGTIAAALVLALVITFVAITDYNLNEIGFTAVKLGISISAGVIFTVLFAAFAASVPMGKRKN